MNRAEALTEFGRFCLRQSAEALELLAEKAEEDGMTSLSTDNLRTVADVWRDQTPDMKDINNIIQGLGFVPKRKYEDLKKENEKLRDMLAFSHAFARFLSNREETPLPKETN